MSPGRNSHEICFAARTVHCLAGIGVRTFRPRPGGTQAEAPDARGRRKGRLQNGRVRWKVSASPRSPLGAGIAGRAGGVIGA